METKTDVRVFLGCFSKDMPRSPKVVEEEGALADHIANKPLWKEGILALEISGTVKEPTPAVKDGQTAAVSGNTYTVTSAAAGTAALTKAKNTKKVTVPDTVAVNGVTLKVTKVSANAFTGKKIRTVSLGKNIDTIVKYAFKKSKARTLIVKTKALTDAEREEIQNRRAEESREAMKRMTDAFQARGGGKPDMVQGNVHAAEAEIRRLF